MPDAASPRFSLAALTVLELSPPEMIAVAAKAGYDAVGLRLIPLLRKSTTSPSPTIRLCYAALSKRCATAALRCSMSKSYASSPIPR